MNLSIIKTSLFLSILFGYSYILSIRVLTVLVAVIMSCLLYRLVFLNSFSIKKNFSFSLSLLVLLAAVLISIYSGSFSIVISTFIFILLTYWPLAYNSKKPLDLAIIIKNIYTNSAIIMSIGVIFQLLLYKKLNISLGLINTYGDNRVAFGFLWSDYSFLSLYIVSAIPLLLDNKNKYKYLLATLLVSASLITSARTGIAALVLAYLLYITIYLYKLINKKKFYIGVCISLLSFIFILILQNNVGLMTRNISAGSSGRFEGYLEAINFFIDNIWIGAGLNHEVYCDIVGVVPHNLFIYPAALGGLLFLVPVLVWIISLAINTMKTHDSSLLLAFLICIIGMQFIPSLFSAYFFAILLSIVMLHNQNSKNKTRS